MSKILLLDSNSLINRAFYALPPLENKKGVYTNAIFGYLSMLARLIVDHKPTHICAVFDLKAPTFRHKRYDLYKATRKPMPFELASQMPILKELLGELGIRICQMEGYEADDIIGTIAKRFDNETIIVSGDRDVLQLVDENTVVFNTKRGVTDIKVYDLETLKEENFTPDRVIEYKALAGDTSDNIPGCPGIGEKTALNLLDTYGNLDGVYENVQSIKGKFGERLRENKEIVYLSKELATINTEVPLTIQLDDIAFSLESISDKFYMHLKELECFKLIPRFDFKKRFEGVELAQLNLLPAVNDDIVENNEERTNVEIINLSSIDELNNVLSNVNGNISIEIGKDLSFATSVNQEYKVICAQSLIDIGVNFDDAINCFKNIFESDKITKVIFDVKDKMHLLKPYGITIVEPYEDVLLKSYLSNSNYS